ncbi:MAG: DNA internalization-related competence protein ComEC/Rec2 [Bacillota bacterium]
MKRPALMPGMLFAVGILTSYYFRIPSELVLILSAFLVLYWIFSLCKGKYSNFILVGLVFLLAVLFTNERLLSEISAYRGEDSLFTGTVNRVYEKEDYYSYDINLASINSMRIQEKVRMNLYNAEPMIPGTVVSFKGKAEEPAYNTNPGLFNYRQYLLTKDIRNIVRVNEATLNTNMDSMDFGYRIQNAFNERIDRVFYEELSQENAGIMKGLLTGDKNDLQAEYEVYRDLGIAHILAISGLHIGIISGFLMLLLSFSGVKRQFSIPVTLVAIWIFGYLIGYPESALRAVVMLTLLMLSKLIHRPTDPVNILAVSFLISLLINPFWVFSIGFQLSYGATISLVCIVPWILEMLYPLKGKVARSLAAVAAVNIGILPLQGYYFNQMPVMALLSNLILIPLATINLILGFIMLLIPVVGPLLQILLDLQRFIVGIINMIPISPISLSSPEPYHVAAYLVFLIAVLRWRELAYVGQNIRKTVVVFLLMIILMNLMAYNEDKPTEIHFIDVGQGDSALIRTADKNYLLDTGGAVFGSYDPGSSITLPYLEKQGIRKLDGIIISHFHEDHYKGALAVLDNLKVDSMYVNGEISDEEMAYKVREKNIPVYIMSQGGRIDMDHENSLECIWPSSSQTYTNENNNSLVLLLKSKGRSILFTGDIEEQVEGKINLDSAKYLDILKVAHHGSDTSSSQSFISITSPANSIISAGRNNTFGHPHESVLRILEEEGSTIYRTDRAGLVKVLLKSEEMEILPYGSPFYQESPIDFIQRYGLALSLMLIYYILSYMEVRAYAKLEENNHEIPGIF